MRLSLGLQETSCSPVVWSTRIPQNVAYVWLLSHSKSVLELFQTRDKLSDSTCQEDCCGPDLLKAGAADAARYAAPGKLGRNPR